MTPDAVDEPVTVVPHDPDWDAQASMVAQEVRGLVGPFISIVHIGSTAVPGLPAKPVLDLMADVVPADRDRAARLLVGKGFSDFGEVSPGRRYLTRRTIPAVNVHLIDPDSSTWQDNLIFRDYLRSHTEAAAAYGDLKLRIADGRRLRAYSDAKAGLVGSLLEAARTWAAGG